MQLSDLGNRICIMGPSNSGKSTLANAISKKCNLKVTHLDQLFHLPNTDWQERSADEFISLHDMAIKEESWVIDGNHTKYFPQRLSRNRTMTKWFCYF
ncbi:GTPase [Xenorhabdus stockiae]|uniref:GTPase n=1 Tax=Xenorhabdus stockiae TaxID=351614 RepID=UPI004062BEED